jgi:hypothetical protein
MRMRTLFATSAVTLALALTACSGDDGSITVTTGPGGDRSSEDTTSPTTERSPSTTPGPSAPSSAEQARYVSDGNAICADMNSRIIALGQELSGQPESPQLLGQALARTGQIIGEAVTQLEALPKPAGDEAEIDAMLADVRAVVDLLPQAADAATRGDAAQYRTLTTQLDSVTAQANASAAAYGLSGCARSDLSDQSA